MPAELKTLVYREKIQDFEQLLLSGIGGNTYQNDETYFRSVDANDLKTWLLDEDWMFQTLHQAATFKTSRSKLVVGTQQRILLGLFITYPEELCLPRNC